VDIAKDVRSVEAAVGDEVAMVNEGEGMAVAGPGRLARGRYGVPLGPGGSGGEVEDVEVGVGEAVLGDAAMDDKHLANASGSVGSAGLGRCVVCLHELPLPCAHAEAVSRGAGAGEADAAGLARGVLELGSAPESNHLAHGIVFRHWERGEGVPAAGAGSASLCLQRLEQSSAIHGPFRPGRHTGQAR
jgi:hypothetical protein